MDDNRSERFLEATEEVTLTVYAGQDASWQSAIVIGAIVVLSDEVVSTRPAAIIYRRAAVTATTICESSTVGPGREWYALKVGTLSGWVADRWFIHRHIRIQFVLPCLVACKIASG